MSLVETVRPKKVPFPVGAACARRSRAEEEFKGGTWHSTCVVLQWVQ